LLLIRSSHVVCFYSFAVSCEILAWHDDGLALRRKNVDNSVRNSLLRHYFEELKRCSIVDCVHLKSAMGNQVFLARRHLISQCHHSPLRRNKNFVLSRIGLEKWTEKPLLHWKKNPFFVSIKFCIEALKVRKTSKERVKNLIFWIGHYKGKWLKKSGDTTLTQPTAWQWGLKLLSMLVMYSPRAPEYIFNHLLDLGCQIKPPQTQLHEKPELVTSI